jgi:CRP-like cAMP-binding protein
MIDFLKKEQLTDSQIKQLLEGSETFDAKKRTILLKEKEKSTTIYFVHSGVLRVGVHDEDAKDWTHCFFTPEGLRWVGLTADNLMKRSSSCFLEVLEDSKITAFSIDYIRELRRSNLEWANFFNCQLMKTFRFLETKTIDTIKLSPEKRYINFVEAYPKLVQNIPQHYIASFIGVAPESLSRIRKRIQDSALQN